MQTLNGLHSVFFRRSQSASLATVLVLHVGVLYALTRGSDYVPARMSVPISISLAPAADTKRAEPRPLRKVVKTPTPQAIAPEPVTDTAPESDQPPQAQVTPPSHDAAHLNNPKMVYPKLSERLGEQGPVVLNVFVTPEGTAREVNILTSSGYSRLDDAAKKAAEGWRYEPARDGNRPIGTWFSFVLRFTLTKKG